MYYITYEIARCYINSFLSPPHLTFIFSKVISIIMEKNVEFYYFLKFFYALTLFHKFSLYFSEYYILWHKIMKLRTNFYNSLRFHLVKMHRKILYNVQHLQIVFFHLELHNAKDFECILLLYQTIIYIFTWDMYDTIFNIPLGTKQQFHAICW